MRNHVPEEIVPVGDDDDAPEDAEGDDLDFEFADDVDDLDFDWADKGA